MLYTEEFKKGVVKKVLSPGVIAAYVAEKLGVAESFSRPRVSNDNAYSESLFNTLKSRAGYPGLAVWKKPVSGWPGLSTGIITNTGILRSAM